MKKAVAALVGLCILFSLSIGSVSAAEQPPLRKTIEEVVGTPYQWGGTSTEGFDCSGFVLYVFKQYDVKLPRTSQSQAGIGKEVKKDDLRAGDLIFFNTSGKGISHAGIYLGKGQFAHSSSSKGVTISKLSESYYAKRYVTARRVLSNANYSLMIGSES